MPSKKIIKTETENYINNAQLDPGWIGKELDFKTLPEKVQRYISGLDSQSSMAPTPGANVIYMPGTPNKVVQVSQMQ